MKSHNRQQTYVVPNSKKSTPIACHLNTSSRIGYLRKNVIYSWFYLWFHLFLYSFLCGQKVPPPHGIWTWLVTVTKNTLCYISGCLITKVLTDVLSSVLLALHANSAGSPRLTLTTLSILHDTVHNSLKITVSINKAEHLNECLIGHPVSVIFKVYIQKYSEKNTNN